MRFSLVIVLVMTALAGTLVWYGKTANQCPVPLSYRLGQLDTHFNITEAEARESFYTAESVWEKEAGRELFVYDEDSDFTINFIFDERQAMSDEEATERAALDAKEGENEKVNKTLASLQEKYETLRASHEKKVRNYEARLSSYNEEVRMYNDRNGAPANVYERLEEERIALNREVTELSSIASELNDLAANINELSERGNALIESYNQQVKQYNERFGEGDEFTQGDYQGDLINVYKFSNETELVGVLAHEFGHALGISEHVSGTSSIMYYLLEEERETVKLSSEDKIAFLAVCGSGSEIEHQIRSVIRKVLTTINF